MAIVGNPGSSAQYRDGWEALATSVSVMGPEKGVALIEKLPNTEAILMTSERNPKIIKTTGADKYIR